MIRIGIDVGSTRTKYMLINDNDQIVDFWSEKTSVRQKEHFREISQSLKEKYGQIQIASCGYGRDNVQGIRIINELKALALGVSAMYGKNAVILDIGGQDTKLISISDGQIKDFFLNEKCAAGCGQFLSNVLTTLGIGFDTLDLCEESEPTKKLSSVCAVFAQTEIVSLISEGVAEREIVIMVLWQILTQAKKLLAKVECDKVILTGGLAQIPQIQQFAEKAFEKTVEIPHFCNYLSALGCTII